MLNHTDRQTQSGHFSHLDPLYGQWGPQFTEINMIWQILYGILQGFSPEFSVFIPQMALAVGRKLFHKFSI
jgi:hypothetical protein